MGIKYSLCKNDDGMKFSLIICTYMRPQPIQDLLASVTQQELYPDEILIVDGSTDNETKQKLEKHGYKNLRYYKVDDANRGLTRQRNYGILKVSDDIDVVCFLDDDIILEKDYFSNLIGTYHKEKDAAGVGGYIINEVDWKKQTSQQQEKQNSFVYDGYVRALGSRHVLRKKLGLSPSAEPCIMPEFSNGYSVSFLPPTNKTYKVEYFMGGVSSFKKSVVDEIKFSTYFEGYGLYEDLDYCLRVSKKYKLFVCTAARLSHYHDEEGRPDKYKYGKMVLRNGWYVWRVGFSKPSFKAKMKWNLIMLLQIGILFSNVILKANRRASFTEAMGRSIGWLGLIFNKPKVH